MSKEFFDLYFEYAGVGRSESPAVFHRWSIIGCVGTMLGRQVRIPFGHGQIYPNQFIMLMGTPGTRKSTAINTAIKVLKATGYARFAGDKTSKEAFLRDMKQNDATDFLSDADLEELTLDSPAEVCIAADEFTDFVGQNNMDFLTMLTKLWDCPPDYRNPKMQGKNVAVHQPTVNILSGNTLQGFSLAFPAEALGNGFMSRLLFIHGEPTGKKVTFPQPPEFEITERVIFYMNTIKERIKGDMSFSKDALNLCDYLYQAFSDIPDFRFKHYSTRRFTHLLKLAMIMAAMDLSLVIQTDHLLQANTILHNSELKMPDALGEYGYSKYSAVSELILDAVRNSIEPMTATAIWKIVMKNLSSPKEMADILRNLLQAGKIQETSIGGKSGYLALFEVNSKMDEKLLLDGFLLPEEYC